MTQVTLCRRRSARRQAERRLLKLVSDSAYMMPSAWHDETAMSAGRHDRDGDRGRPVMDKPIILAVETDQPVADALDRDLRKRFSADYDVLVERFPATALERLRTCQRARVEVALLIAGLWMAADSSALPPRDVSARGLRCGRCAQRLDKACRLWGRGGRDRHRAHSPVSRGRRPAGEGEHDPRRACYQAPHVLFLMSVAFVPVPSKILGGVRRPRRRGGILRHQSDDHRVVHRGAVVVRHE